MAEFNQNLWAPWRMEYIHSMADEAREGGCFLCDYWAAPHRDGEHHVVWRSPCTFVVMNRFPYTNGHLMVAFGAHRGDPTELTESEFGEMARGVRDAVSLLRRAVKPEGFNIGYNIGRCAGAGLPDHLHAHIVPRWSGDTNFMAVLGDVRVVPDALDALYQELVAHARALGFRT
ncbi:MAG: HIT domain-containing protein [Planctomycetes bacterium]|nr:HIT domain-containing protein [Planctomycetota bacterium]